MSRKSRRRDGTAGILGVTLATPQFMEVARHAADHWHRMTGLDCVILSAASDRDAWFIKLRLPSVVARRPICFFDADLWMIQPGDVGAVLERNPGGVTAVRDPGRWDTGMFPWNDSQQFGDDPEQYFNSGWFVCDLGNEAVQEWFEAARKLHRGGAPVRDFGEQSYLNAAIRLSGVPLVHAPRAWNAHPGGIDSPLSIIGLHAMGIPVCHKVQALKNWERALEHGRRGARLNEPMMPMPYRSVENYRPCYEV